MDIRSVRLRTTPMQLAPEKFGFRMLEILTISEQTESMRLKSQKTFGSLGSLIYSTLGQGEFDGINDSSNQ